MKIDCKSIFSKLQNELAEKIKSLFRPPSLAVILTGNNSASKIYVSRKQKACAEVGITSHLFVEGTDFQDYKSLYKLIISLNKDPKVDGILLQLPLSDEFKIYQKTLINLINPKKDVDVFHYENIGLLIQGTPRFIPCTPQGIQLILKESNLSIRGKHVVIINRSLLIGQPLSSMLIQDTGEWDNSTVTVCHIETPPEELKKMCLLADVVIVAVGIPGFLKADMIKEGSIVIDVGINRQDNKVVGDCDKSIYDKAGYYTSVPEGVGVSTIYCLLNNTYQAALPNIQDDWLMSVAKKQDAEYQLQRGF